MAVFEYFNQDNNTFEAYTEYGLFYASSDKIDALYGLKNALEPHYETLKNSRDVRHFKINKINDGYLIYHSDFENIKAWKKCPLKALEEAKRQIDIEVERSYSKVCEDLDSIYLKIKNYKDEG